MEDIFYKQAKEEIRKELEGSFGRDLFRIINKRESNVAKAFCIASGCNPIDINKDGSFIHCAENTCKKLNVFITECKKYHSISTRLENPELIEHLR